MKVINDDLNTYSGTLPNTKKPTNQDTTQNVCVAGFREAFEICCGYHGIGYDVWCGNKGNVNGSEVYADSCPNVSSVISWDGVHYSEAANHWIANRIFKPSFISSQI